jgi:hypothetical protein
MMAEKARLFGDLDTLDKIVSCTHPGEAKQLGRQVRDFDQTTWTHRRSEIVVRGNRAKFDQNLALGEFLIGTGDRVIVEASPRDMIWGIGLDKNNPKAQDPKTWRGENLLGFALMQVRALLRDGE